MKTRECDVGGAVRLPKQFYERPLTLEESRFASEHISIVYRYLRQQGLNSDEWFDVVIFRYLLSVKRYFALPELQKLKFITVRYCVRLFPVPALSERNRWYESHGAQQICLLVSAV